MTDPMQSVALSDITVFEGNEGQLSASLWLEALEGVAELFNWSDERKLKVARCKLNGHAQLWERGIRNRALTWSAFKIKFEQRFGYSEEDLYHQLASCCQRTGETVKHYADRFLALCLRLRIDIEADRTLLPSFMRGLLPQRYQKIYMLRPNTLKDAIEQACYLDDCDALAMESALSYNYEHPQDDIAPEEAPHAAESVMLHFTKAQLSLSKA